MVETVRWGILGASRFAMNTMLPALHVARGGCVRALATRSPEKAAPAKRMIPDLGIETSYEALLTRDDIDAVYIPLPNHLHVEYAQKAMRAGKHVLCEKPLALRAAEIDGLIDLRDRTGLFCAEGFMVVHHPQWQRARQLIAAGEIGRVRHITGDFSFFNNDPENIRNRANAGGGALRDIGVYPMVTARYAMDAEPEIEAAKIDWDDGIDAAARVSARLGDASFDFAVSMRMFRGQAMTFIGEEGRLTLPAPFNAELYKEAAIHIATGKGERTERFPAIDQYVCQAEAVHAAIQTGADYPVSLEFSRANQMAIDAVYEAAGAAH